MNVTKERFNKKFGRIRMKMTGVFKVVENYDISGLSPKWLKSALGNKYIELRGRSKEGRITIFVRPEKIENSIYKKGEILALFNYDFANCVNYKTKLEKYYVNNFTK